MKRERGSWNKQSAARRRRSRGERAFSLRRGSKPRTSRYQIAVPALNQEARWHSIPPRLVDAALLIVVGWLIYWFTSADIFYVHNLQVEGSWRLAQTELRALSGLEGVNIFWINTGAAERALEALPDVESAHVRCILPAECVIELVERPASLIWRQGDAQVWIGEDGVVLPTRGDLPNAIVLDAVGSTALKPGDRLDQDLVLAVEALAELQPDVRVYQYSDEYGLSFQSDYGWLVRLGDGREIETKTQLLGALTDFLISRGITPGYVDVRYPEAPYYGE